MNAQQATHRGRIHRTLRQRWERLTISTWGPTVLLAACLVFGLLVVWALHPTFPPMLRLPEPGAGSWSWALHTLFDWGRALAALTALLVLAVLFVAWCIHLVGR